MYTFSAGVLQIRDFCYKWVESRTTSVLILGREEKEGLILTCTSRFHKMFLFLKYVLFHWYLVLPELTNCISCSESQGFMLWAGYGFFTSYELILVISSFNNSVKTCSDVAKTIMLFLFFLCLFHGDILFCSSAQDIFYRSSVGLYHMVGSFEL